uniref:Uncharacterized protein n=1 Tax=Arundo donax TaxID=35708 RepID=A0A0A9ECP4_ARUDO
MMQELRIGQTDHPQNLWLMELFSQMQRLMLLSVIH